MAVLLRRLKIHRFRKVAPGTEIHFHPGMNVLLGLNASGKTTLLELIAAVLRGDLSRLHHFHLEFELEADGCRLEVICGFESEWVETPGGELEVDQSHLEARGFDSRGALVGRVELTRSPMVPWVVHRGGEGEGGPVPDDLWSTLVEHVGASIWSGRDDRPRFAVPGCRRVDEALVCFDEIHGQGGEGVTSFRAIWRNGDPVRIDARGLSGDLAARVASHMGGWSAQPPLVIVDETESSLLADLARRLGFSACLWRATPREQRRDGPRVIAEYGRFAFAFTREDGSFIDDAILSYGQKRLLALLYQMCAHDGPFVVDELVNGLHHAWIEQIVDGLDGRQVFVSTQSPLLLDHLTFESAEEVRRTFVFCRRRAATDAAPAALVWSALSDDDARAFFDAYQAGIQHVSELLRTRGLW
ncbi:MAG: AAA family ATPase [Polyangiales bacterium]